MIEVNIPQNLSLINALNFCNRLWNLEHKDEYVFDFIHLGHVEPFTLAYVANELKRFRSTKLQSGFKAKNHESKSYAAHMGFLKLLDWILEMGPVMLRGATPISL